MRITIYHSYLCPRCLLARKWLKELSRENRDLDIIEIDVLAHPVQTWKAGVRLIPTIKSGVTNLSGIYLSKNAITTFLASMK
jgi:predicted DsbA family dithiol-disulfide isomerase